MSSTGLRLVPAPQADPPYDDEVPPLGRRFPPAGSETAAVQGALALNFLLPSGLPAEPEVRGLRLVAEAPGPRWTALPDPQAWAARLVQAVCEVLAGDRPLTQLLRWVDGEVYADIERRVTVHARRQPPKLAKGPRAAVRSVHVTAPRAQVSEVSVIVQRGTRAAAVAVRLEGRNDRWLCTALEIG